MKILSLSGFIPEQVCDTVRFTQYSGDRNIPHFCGYVSDFISRVLQDEDIDGAVYPKSCDSTRIMTSYMSDCGKFLHQITVPSANAAGAADHFADEIKRYKKAVESFYGISINDIKERSEMINDRNEAIRRTYEDIQDLSYPHYLRSIHDLLKLPLKDQKWDFQDPGKTSSAKRVFLVGSFLSDTEIVDIIEQSGLSVAGDNLPESGRLISRKPVNVLGDIYMGIAQSILSAGFSPTQNLFRDIMESDFDEMNKKAVKGIIFVTQKYCEAYDYLYSVYKTEADMKGIPIIRISVDNFRDYGKASLVLEAFADTL